MLLKVSFETYFLVKFLKKANQNVLLEFILNTHHTSHAHYCNIVHNEKIY